MGVGTKFFAVYLAGISGLWKGVPVGIGLNLPPFFTGLFTGLGSVTAVLIIFFAGESFRNWILNKYGSKNIEKKKNRFSQMANRYGIWGLGLVTAGLLGPYTSMLLGFILIKEIKKFLFILITGIFIWSFAFAYFFTPIVGFILKIKNL